MPITDNDFSAQELQAAIEAKPELLNHVTGVLSAKKYVVRDEKTEQEFKTNYENDIVSRKTKEWAGNIEKDVKEIFGIDKAENEKYYDYFKRAGTTFKGNFDKLNTELTELRAKGGGASDADLKRIKALEAKLETDQKGFATEKEKYEAQILGLKAENKMEGVLSTIRPTYNTAIPESVIKIAEGAAVANIMKGAKINAEGNLIFHDAAGELMTDPTSMKPLTADVILKEALKDIIDAGRKAEGAGGEGGKGGGKGEEQKGDKKWTGLPANVTTKVALHEYLLKLGYAVHEEEFNKLYNEHGAKLPLK